MISPKKITVLLSPTKIKKILKKESKKLGVNSKSIKEIKIKVIKEYIDWRSFSLVILYSLNKQKKIIGIANSDGKKNYGFKINKLIFKQFSKKKTKKFSAPKPYCYLKPLELFLREHLKGENFGEILKKKKEIKTIHIKRIVEIIVFLQKLDIAGSFIKKGIDFSDIEKNIKILKQRKVKEVKILSKIFKKTRKKIKDYEKKNRNKVLVHGDFNPYNFFFEQDKIKIADFGSSHLGDRISDLASLLSQLKTSLDFKIPKEKRLSLENILLDYYQKITKKFDDSEQEKLKIYRTYFDILIVSHIIVWGNSSQGIKILTKLKHF